MVVTIVHVKVKPEYIQNFIEATKLNHQYSIQEPENMRFDICKLQTIEPNLFSMKPTKQKRGLKLTSKLNII